MRFILDVGAEFAEKKVSPSRTTAGEPWSAYTDYDGYFTIPLSDEDVNTILDGRRHREILFKIYGDGDVIIGSQSVYVSLATFRGSESLSLAADPSTVPTTASSFAVSGFLVQADGTPIAGTTIILKEQKLRSTTSLGTATTDAQGRFLIRYTPGSGSSDVGNLSVTLATPASGTNSGVFCNPPSDFTVRLIHLNEPYRGRSQFALDVATLGPLLDTATLDELGIDDIKYLNCRTEHDANVLASLARAHVLADRFALPAAAFAAFANAGISLSAAALTALNDDEIEETIEQAIEENLVPASLAANIPTIVATLAAARIDRLVPSSDPGSTQLGAILVASGMAAGKPRLFAEAYAARTGTIEEFWTDLRANASFGDALVDKIQFSLQTGAISGGHTPLVKLLDQLRTSGEFTRALELAKYDESFWLHVLDETVDSGLVGTPSGFVGADPTEKKANFAAAITHMVADLYPSAHLAARLPAGTAVNDVFDFVKNNPGFSFETTNITSFLPTAVGYPALPEDRETLRQDLLKVQRVFAISPRFGRTDAAIALFNGGVHSAAQVRRMGRSAFTAQFGAALDEETLTSVYEKAEQVASSVLNSWLLMRPEMHQPAVRAIPRPSSTDPELQALFDSRYYCACPPCESVLGPAAYYCDILHFLYRQDPINPLATLRPDLAYVDFSCKNSDTALPTIDLINEVLEYRAFDLLEVDGSPHVDRQTHWDAEDLLVYPEHIELGVYQKLTDPTKACFPLDLPFDLAFEESRAYLDVMGTSRLEIQDRLEWFAGIDENDAFRVNERLGLSAGQASIIRELAGTPGLDVRWGFEGDADWVEHFHDAETFVNRTGLNLAGLRELLLTKDLAGHTVLKFAKPCTLVGAKLVLATDHSQFGLDNTRMRMLQAFLRIKRAVGWTTPELDSVSRALDTTFNSAGFDGLSQFLRIRRQFPRLPLGEVLSWLAPLDRKSYHEDEPSYYDEVVRPAVIDPAFVSLNGSQTLSDFRPEIIGILQTDEAGLDAALAATGLGATSDLDLPNLSMLYRVASIARAVKLSIQDLLALTKYKTTLNSVPGAFAGSSMPLLRDLLEVARSVTGAGFTVPEFDWIYRGLHPDKFGGDDVSVMRVLISLIGALQQALKDHEQGLPPGTATPLQQVERLLAGPLPVQEVDVAMAFIRKQTSPEPAPLGAYRAEHLFFLADGGPAAAELDTPFADAGDPEERAEKVVVELTVWLRRQALERAVVQQLSAVFALDIADTDALLRKFDASGIALTQLTDDVFFDENAFDPNVDAPDVQKSEFLHAFLLRPGIAPRVTLYRLLRRAALLAVKLRLGPGLLQWLLAQPADAAVHLPNIAALASQTAYQAYLGWDWLHRAVQLRDRSFVTGDALIRVLESIFVPPEDFDKTAALTKLSVATDWDLTQLLAFEDAQPIAQLDLKRLFAIEATAAAFELSEQLGVNPNTVRRWAKEAVTTTTAAEIRNAARAKLGNNGWTAIAHPVRDRLRLKQRDALADYLVHKEGLQNREDLFGLLLTDVDLAPCSRTTRILFATGAVQLFLQRGFMNLQPGLTLSDGAAAEWAWTKRYRVWEANRKVFLYPENWVRPELRDDKSELFRRLENELSQSELDGDAVERAFIHYLEGVDEVAHLEPSGMYHEVESKGAGVDRMHVFAHSYADPSRLFYRRRETDGHWTAWERLPFQVEHGGSLPLVIDRRLRLVWPHVQIKRSQPTTFDQNLNTPPVQREVPEVGLFWSELLSDGWSSVRSSEDRILLEGYREWYDGAVRLDRIHLTSSSDDSSTIIRVNGRDKHSKEPLTDEMVTLAGFAYDRRRDQFIKASTYSTPIPHKIVVINTGAKWRYQGLTTNTHKWYRTVNLVFPSYDNWGAAVIRPQLSTPTGLLFPRQTRDHDVTRPFLFTDKDVALYMRPAPASQESESLDDFKALEDISKQNLVPYLGLANIISDAVDPPADDALMNQLLADDVPTAQNIWTPTTWKSGYEAIPFYHPYAGLFIERVRRFGVGGLLDPLVAAQIGDATLLYQAADASLRSDHEYFEGLNSLSAEEPRATIDFSSTAAYSVYNWEIFFHIPMLVADRLMAERRFADAQRWLGYIFNPLRRPTELGGGKSHFWGFKPFREASASLSIESLLATLQYKGNNPALNKQKAEMIAQIEHSRTNPFSPHGLARARPTAYMRTVVMKYLDNLIAWGDDLFRQDTRESTQEAAQLYILALQILGSRPREVDGESRPDKNWTEALATLDEFSNFMVELENEVMGFAAKDFAIATDHKAQHDHQLNFATERQFAFVRPREVQQPVSDQTLAHHSQPMSLNTIITSGPVTGPAKTRLYFCVPPNDKLLAYWDTVADRLFKLRNCLNIEGVRRDLALYDPPIDPALLVKAAAQGIDIGTAVSNLYAPLPHYRFLPHLSIAKDFVAQVSNLGAAFLQALEKREAEELATLRSGHELDLLRRMRAVRDQGVREAVQNLEVTRRSREVAVLRESYYNKQSSEFMNTLEKTEVSLSKAATVAETLAAGYHGLAGVIMATVPGLSVGVNGPFPTLSLSIGGGVLAWPIQAMGDSKTLEAQTSSRESVRTAAQASYTRRREEWRHQASLAAADIRQLDAQLTAAEIRRQMAEFELSNLDSQIEQSAEVLNFMQTKFTNAELYSWMVDELWKIYTPAYQMALDLARRAERCYRYELSVPAAAPDFIQFGHWDNRRRGLLAGERLAHDVRRMEASYYENNRREYELTKRISLASLDPVALISLRKTGACHFNLPSVLFDLDHPGHYLRRIKLMSVALPAVTGPYTNVGVTLTYESGSIRTTPVAGSLTPAPGTAQSVAISVSQDDAGLFEPNLRDERYLPFEGRALEDSKWRLEMPGVLRQFDYETISDVILTVRYTAREGGAILAAAITEELTTALQEMTREEEPKVAGQVQLFSARAEFPEAWRSFVADGSSGPAVLDMDFEEQRFPHPVPALGERKIEAMLFFVRWAADDAVVPDSSAVFEGSVLTGPLPNTPIDPFPFTKYKGAIPAQSEKHHNYVWFSAPELGSNDSPGTWKLEVPGWSGGHSPEDLIVAVAYKVTGV